MNNASQVNGKWLYFRLFYSLGGKSTVCSGSYFLSRWVCQERAEFPELDSAKGSLPGKVGRPQEHFSLPGFCGLLFTLAPSSCLDWCPGMAGLPVTLQPPPPSHCSINIPKIPFEHVTAHPTPTQMLFPRGCQGARGRDWVSMPEASEWVGGGSARIESFVRTS